MSIRRFAAAGLAVVLAVVGVRASVPRSAQADDVWPIGVAQPIAVADGHARFIVPCGSSTARTLVVVSALTRTPGSYPIRIVARPASKSVPPSLANDGPFRPAASMSPIAKGHSHEAHAAPKAERTFYLPVRDGDAASANNYASVRARLRHFGPHVQVYVDVADDRRVSDATLRDVVSTFEGRIRPVAETRIGLAPDADDDGRFAILFSSWLGALADGKLAVDGYVRGADLEPTQAPPFGNRADVMYLNAAMGGGPHLRTVMAHEYTHAVTYGRKALGPAGRDEEGWLDEALAHLSEDIHGFSRSNLDHRVAAFLAAPECYRLLVEDFGAPETIRSHGHRGAAYLFLRWCADHCGPDLFERLVRSRRCGVANLEAETGRPFASLYRGWSTGVFLDGMNANSAGGPSLPSASRVVVAGVGNATILDATTTHYAIIEGTDANAVEICVDGPGAAQIQVTAVPLPRDYPRLDLQLEVVRSRDKRAVVARIRECDGQNVTLQSLEWSTLDGRQIGELDAAGLKDAFGRVSLESGQGIESNPLPIPEGHCIMTAFGEDSRHRRVVARAEIGKPSDRIIAR